MTITRAKAETILIERVGALMVAVGFDGDTHDGSNQNLNDPLLYALWKTGSTSVENVIGVTDDDLDALAAADYAKFFDLAELRLLMNIRGNLSDVDITVGPRREMLSQRARLLDDMIKRKQMSVEQEYGIGSSELQIGQINLNFQAKNDDVIV